MRQFLILIEHGPENLSAYVPSLPGCVTTGKTRQEVIVNMYEAIRGHLEVMAEYGEGIPDEDLEAMTLVVPDPVPQLAVNGGH
ncbi:MAG: type II toxin-antitoxin system HicB family antitoxin [Caldilineaceae bacterium]|nr:type II toxin-antitoxin system HicB family antitoxin [Caldilineaceae bacterium]